MSDGGPAGRAGARLHGGRATAPVRVALFRHEGVVVSNHQHLRGLEWLTGEWELCLADGGTLTAPADLPALAPGETRVVPLPFEVPRDGGEAWLTLRVRTAEDLPWAPRGTEVCSPQVRLRGPTVTEDPSRGGTGGRRRRPPGIRPRRPPSPSAAVHPEGATPRGRQEVVGPLLSLSTGALRMRRSAVVSRRPPTTLPSTAQASHFSQSG